MDVDLDKHDETLARMAGNIAGTVMCEYLKSEERDIKTLGPNDIRFVAFVSVLIARETLIRALLPPKDDEEPPVEPKEPVDKGDDA